MFSMTQILRDADREANFGKCTSEWQFGQTFSGGIVRADYSVFEVSAYCMVASHCLARQTSQEHQSKKHSEQAV